MRRHHVTNYMIAALLGALTLGACSGHRYYDPYYSDYHRWDSTEDGFYRRWEGQTGRSHLDFGRRPEAEQRTYFSWRHGR